MASRVACFLSLTLLLGELVILGRAGAGAHRGVGAPYSASLPGTRRCPPWAPGFWIFPNVAERVDRPTWPEGGADM